MSVHIEHDLRLHLGKQIDVPLKGQIQIIVLGLRRLFVSANMVRLNIFFSFFLSFFKLVFFVMVSEGLCLFLVVLNVDVIVVVRHKNKLYIHCTHISCMQCCQLHNHAQAWPVWQLRPNFLIAISAYILKYAIKETWIICKHTQLHSCVLYAAHRSCSD